MIQESLIEYEHSGTVLEGWLAYDDSTDFPVPGVMVAHAWGGRGEFECNKARALAKLGYTGFALDLFGKGVLGSGPDENQKLMGPFLEDRALLQSRMTAALDTLKSQTEVDADRLAAIGFCFGGLGVLDLARIGTDIRGVVSFHGLFMPPNNTEETQIKAKVLALHGNDDPMVPADDVVALGKELTAAGADWQIHTYGNTLHAFTKPEANDPGFGTVYNEQADRRSWQAMKNFLEEIF